MEIKQQPLTTPNFKDYFLNVMTKLGLNPDQIKLKMIHCASSYSSNELEIINEVKKGTHPDVVYFIFENYDLSKIGKVGGGDRCLYKRLGDYRSRDPIGIKIKNSIVKGHVINILALDVSFIPSVDIFGKKVKGVYGPTLEKIIIPIAKQLGYSLKWNKNNG
jgi:hypothetical protein